MTELVLSELDAITRVLHLMIFAEMWNKVILWWSPWWSLWDPGMSTLRLSQLSALLGLSDVVVFSELWHEVVSWVWLGHWLSDDIGIADELGADNLLCVMNANTHIFHICVSTEVWNKIVLRWSTIRLGCFPGEEWLSVDVNAVGLSEQSNNC